MPALPQKKIFTLVSCKECGNRILVIKEQGCSPDLGSKISAICPSCLPDEAIKEIEKGDELKSHPEEWLESLLLAMVRGDSDKIPE